MLLEQASKGNKQSRVTYLVPLKRALQGHSFLVTFLEFLLSFSNLLSSSNNLLLLPHALSDFDQTWSQASMGTWLQKLWVGLTSKVK